MSDIAIKVENVGKLYRLGEIGTGTLSHDLSRWWAKLRGREDPFAKIGEANDRTIKGKSEYVWALQDIDFEIKKGEAVGIIGRNGAGKSTLLKLLSKVTKPSTGNIKVSGRIASLLEVGTGFHPEMTGRENIYLNGAILGMTKKEITRKFDEIVDFSGVERYIDTPVKRYSSGMYVRLAFAVAANLENEILIVDEVLAVGDAEFQKKCLGKMGDVSKGEGRTVLFVSHNMAAIQNLCDTCILLNNGKIQNFSDTNFIMALYHQQGYRDNIIVKDKQDVYITNITFESLDNNEIHRNSILSLADVTIAVEIFSKIEIPAVHVGYGINHSGIRILTPFSKHFNKEYKIHIGANRILLTIPRFLLKPGEYELEIYIGYNDKTYEYYDEGFHFEVGVSSFLKNENIPGNSQGNIIISQIWK